MTFSLSRYLKYIFTGVFLMLFNFTVAAADDLLSNFAFQDKPININQNQAFGLIEKDAAVVIDVRTPEEYATAHWPNAYNIPLDSIITHDPKYLRDIALLKKHDVPVLLYCRSGRRSGLAMLRLSEDFGLRRLMNAGGIQTWPYDTTTFFPVRSFEEAVKSVRPL